ncbi:MAG: hypothetical protein ACYTEW_16115, partial [Planctomycetota bacterium]
ATRISDALTGPKECLQSSAKSGMIMCNLVSKNSSALQLFVNLGLSAYPNNPLYCSRLQSPMPALSAKNVLNVEKTTSGEYFWPAALASNFSLGLITTRLFG